MGGRSLKDLIHHGETVALKLVERDPIPGTSLEVEMIAAWADGLVGKHALDMVSGRCSLQAMLDFDPELFERNIAAEVAAMERLLSEKGAHHGRPLLHGATLSEAARSCL